MPRTYRKSRRVVAENETRQRIVDAAVELHQELGPRATTISAIAGRAGVQRLTVYRHFPDERRLLEACTSCWLERNPPPDPGTWSAIVDPLERCGAALNAIYGYYERTQAMWHSAFRDEAHVPALAEPMVQFRGYLAALADDLAEAFPDATPWLRATIQHAVMFSTWAELTSQPVPVADPPALACRWIIGARGA